jgi:hypothetical protein
MKNSLRLLLPALLIAVLFSGDLRAQVATRVASLTPDEAAAGIPLAVAVDLTQAADLEGIILLYRSFGESEFRRIEMDLRGTRATATIPAGAILPPFLEVYLVLRDRSGKLEVYPLGDSPDPLSTPPQNTKRIMVRAEETDAGALFLSPEPSSILVPEEVLISVSLFRTDSTVARNATRVLFDGVDVTDKAVFAGDLISFVPANAGIDLSPGMHTASVRLMDSAGRVLSSPSVSFTVRSGLVTLAAEAPTSAFRASGSFLLESRYEDTGTDSELRSRASVTLRGSAGELKLRSNLFLTSEEKSSRQPQNRYFLGAELPWLRVGLGDAYPEFPDLILSGKRVRGVNGSLLLGAFNVDVAYGSVTRSIEGAELSRFPTDSLLSEQQRDPSAFYGPVPGDPTRWGKYTYGTYERTLFAVRPSFGSGETMQFGLTWLSGKDDVGSIRYGIRPQENVVLGTDFVARFDDRRIELSAQAAFSAFNSDISSGNFTDAHIDSVYPDDADGIKTLRDIIQPFITVNDNLRPLSLKKAATVAGQASLTLSYLDNTLKVTGLYRGNDYASFGQSYLRTDIAGFNIIDRIRLFRNQVYATLGVEQLQDNRTKTKPATTTYTNMNAAITLALHTDMPGFTIGYSRFANDNALRLDVPTAVNDVTNRFSLTSSYSFLLGVRHTAMLGISSSRRDDRTFRGQDVNSTQLGLSVGSRFPFALQTEVSVSANFNDLPGAVAGTLESFDYTALSFHGRYEVLRNELSLFATVGPTFGAFDRILADAGCEWRMSPPMSLTVQMSTFRTSGLPGEQFASLRYRYEFCA